MLHFIGEPPRLRASSETYLGLPLVVEGEDVVSSPCLALTDQKHPVTLWAGALHQVGRLDPGDGPVEPWVGEQEVVGLLHDLLRQGEGDGAWRTEQRNKWLHY